MRSSAPLSPVLLVLLTACGAGSGETTTQDTTAGSEATDGSAATASSGEQPTAGETGETGSSEASTIGTTDEPATGDTTGDTTGDPTTDPTTGDPGDRLDGLELQQTFEQGVLNGWAKVERWKDVANPGFIQEDRFDLDMRSGQNGPRLTYFGDDPVPHASVFIVYYAPGWDAARRSTPVLLVHGADQADRAWANPGELGDYGCGQKTCPNTGLMQDLVAEGHSVFAVSFAHVHGDNYFWAEQIHNTIRIIRARTGAAKVDLIGWSKGTMPVRIYTSSLTQPWSTPYQDDVRKVVLIGGPNLGMDYSFRYGTALNGSVVSELMLGGKNHAPLPHDEFYLNFKWVPIAEYGIYKSASGDNFRGQLQSVARWDAKYPLTGVANFGLGEFVVGDSESTYVGDADAKVKAIYARGKGIDAAIAQGSLIDAIVEAGVPDSIETYLLCGDIDIKDSSKMLTGVPNEIAGPSDGVVFIDSCAAEDGIGNVAGSALLPWNHLQLGFHADAVAQLLTWLGE